MHREPIKCFWHTTICEAEQQDPHKKNRRFLPENLHNPFICCTFAAILERCSIMETKEQQVRESQAWRAARETQGTIIIHDPKYM